MPAMIESAGGCEMGESSQLGLPTLYIWTGSREKQIIEQGWKWREKVSPKYHYPA
jgi:hypothetical protein